MLSVTLNASTSLTFTITNPNTGLALTNVSFTDALPAGLVVSTPSSFSNSCGGTASGLAGAGSTSLSGATLAANASCTVLLNVTGTTAGTKNNSVTVSSTNGGTGNTSNASLTVGDYTLSINVNTPVVIQGSNSNPATLTATPSVAYAGTIVPATTTCTPAGFTCTFSNITLPGGGVNNSGSSLVSVSIAPATTVGNYNLTLTATDSSNPAVSHSVPFTLAVECMFSLTSPTFIPQTTTAAAAYSVTVAEAQGGTVCPWTAAASGTAGVSITMGSSGTDTAVNTGLPVNFQVAPNVSNAVENGRITVSYFASPVNPGTSVLSVTQELSVASSDVIAGGNGEADVTVTQSGARAASISFNSPCGALDTNNNPDPLANNFGITCTALTTDLPLAAGTTIPITVNVPVTATASLQAHPKRNSLAAFYALGFAIPGIVFLGLGTSVLNSKMRGGWLRFIGLILALSMAALLVGCGGGFHALVVPKGNPNNFTLTMVGTVYDGTGGTGNVTGIEIYTITVNVTPQI